MSRPIELGELCSLMAKAWPDAANAHGVDMTRYGPIIDGHSAIGFSVRIFGTPPHSPGDVAAVGAAKRALLQALENAMVQIDRDVDMIVRGWV